MAGDLVLLWLWRRLAATALIQPLHWEPLYAAGVALKKKKKMPHLFAWQVVGGTVRRGGADVAGITWPCLEEARVQQVTRGVRDHIKPTPPRVRRLQHQAGTQGAGNGLLVKRVTRVDWLPAPP